MLCFPHTRIDGDLCFCFCVQLTSTCYLLLLLLLLPKSYYYYYYYYYYYHNYDCYYYYYYYTYYLLMLPMIHTVSYDLVFSVLCLPGLLFFIHSLYPFSCSFDVRLAG